MTDRKTTLVDARNFAELAPHIRDVVSRSDYVGYDLETYDNAHEGILKLRAKNKKKVIFDNNRTVIAGFSICGTADESETWYVNLNHADVENRIAWEDARTLLEAKRPDANWVCHNAPFEITMMRKSLGFELGANVICSLQLCATCYNPDTYPLGAFTSLGAMKPIFDEAIRKFHDYEGGEMSSEQADLYYKVAGKQSKAAHSWNGHVRSMAYGFGLKSAVEKWFGVKMTTFEECLGDKAHMGELTGEETFEYGGDDAYWCLQLMKLMFAMNADRPQVLKAFFETENPMVQTYANVWSEGTRVDSEAIAAQRFEERIKFADELRKLQGHIAALLPFKDEPVPALMKQDWYEKNHAKYRQQIAKWATTEHEDIVASVPGATAAAFDVKGPGPNFSHYMPVRTLLYDLLGLKPIYVKGKMASDDDARETCLGRVEKDTPQHGVLLSLNAIARIEQRMKLYITPYMCLTDPDTHRLYSTLQSQLATRRTSSENPNDQQLAKRGESVFVRGYVLADREDHVVVSLDWSQIELVLVGEMSGDPEFAAAYGQRPYNDLHIGATVDCLSVLAPDLTVEAFKALKRGLVEGVPEAVLSHGGKAMEPEKAFKFWRTEVGKGANFNYWYSGALSSVGERLGWTSEQMWAATDKYRQRFAVAEQWRQETIQRGVSQGYILLPDGTRRDRIEATPLWADRFHNIIQANYGTLHTGAHKMAQRFIRDTQRRAGNQLVNALIQGTCGTLAKRSQLAIDREIKAAGFDARFMKLIHDELVFSVRIDQAIDFITMARRIMCDHPELISNLVIDCTASVGRTFEPYHPEKAPFGQIELDEAPALSFIPSSVIGQSMNNNHIGQTLEYLRAA